MFRQRIVISRSRKESQKLLVFLQPFPRSPSKKERKQKSKLQEKCSRGRCRSVSHTILNTNLPFRHWQQKLRNPRTPPCWCWRLKSYPPSLTGNENLPRSEGKITKQPPVDRRKILRQGGFCLKKRVIVVGSDSRLRICKSVAGKVYRSGQAIILKRCWQSAFSRSRHFFVLSSPCRLLQDTDCVMFPRLSLCFWTVLHKIVHLLWNQFNQNQSINQNPWSIYTAGGRSPEHLQFALSV